MFAVKGDHFSENLRMSGIDRKSGKCQWKKSFYENCLLLTSHLGLCQCLHVCMFSILFTMMLVIAAWVGMPQGVRVFSVNSPCVESGHRWCVITQDKTACFYQVFVCYHDADCYTECYYHSEMRHHCPNLSAACHMRLSVYCQYVVVDPVPYITSFNRSIQGVHKKVAPYNFCCYFSNAWKYLHEILRNY